MRRTQMRRKAPVARKVIEGGHTRAQFNDDSRCRECAKRKAHDHHVVFEQHVDKAGGDINDPMNALALCVDCHADLAHRYRLPLTALRDENFVFAFALLGNAAHGYLRRRYIGEDPRLDAIEP